MKDKVQKIVYVITKSNFGGAQKYVYEIATEMTMHNKEVLVIFGGNGALKSKLEEKNIHTISLNALQRDLNIFSDLKSFFQLIKIFSKEKPDIIHLNSSKAGAIGALAARISNIFGGKSKIIFTIHGWAFNENRNWFSKLLIKKIYWLTIAMSHISIAVSETTKKDGESIPFFFLIRKKITIIKNSIKNIDFFDRNFARKFIAERIGRPINDNTVIVTSIAELHKIKGIEYLADASEYLVKKNMDFITIVFGDGDNRKFLEKFIADKKIESNFYLCGTVENAAKYLKGSDIYISSSLSEGLSLVLLEARQAEIKIIATNIGGNIEALENYKNSLFINPRSSEEISNAIEIMANNKVIIDNNNYQTFQEMIEKILETYSD